MADSILLSGAVRQNIATLRSTADLMATAQNHLATGKKVNSAFDNPINFFQASTFNRRASDLGTVLDGMGVGVKTLQSADSALTAITNLVTAAQSTANTALASIGTTARRTGTVTGLTAASSFAVTSGNTITISDGVSTATITSTGAVTVQQIMDGVNLAPGLNVKASLSSDGRLNLEATSTNVITIAGTATAPAKLQYGLANGTTAAGTLNTSRSSQSTQFTSTLAQIDQLASDAGFNGVNLLNGGSLKINFNENATTSLSVSGVTDTSAGLGLAAATNTWQTDKDINDALTALSAGLATLKAQSGIFSSNLSIIQARQDFTSSTIDTLKSAADSLVVADTNEEGANLLALQARQSLSTTALSLAAQSDQSVLRLFG